MLAKGSPIVVRASAALPAAGAYDSSPVAIAVGDAKSGMLRITYTRGAAGGQCKFKVADSDATSGTFYERTIDQNSLTVSGGEGSTSLYTAAKLLPVPASGTAESRNYLIDLSQSKAVQVSFAEVGVTATPGTVYCDIVLGINPSTG